MPLARRLWSLRFGLKHVRLTKSSILSISAFRCPQNFSRRSCSRFLIRGVPLPSTKKFNTKCSAIPGSLKGFSSDSRKNSAEGNSKTMTKSDQCQRAHLSVSFENTGGPCTLRGSALSAPC